MYVSYVVYAYCLCMYGCMDGWMVGWPDAWLGGWTDMWMYDDGYVCCMYVCGMRIVMLYVCM